MDEVVVFVLSVSVAASLIAVMGHYVIPTIADATAQEAEYAALRATSPTLILSSDRNTVHVCISSTLPTSVLKWVADRGWLQADRNRYINGEFCAWYLGAYKVGDPVVFMLRGQHAVVIKKYTVAAIRPLS